MFWSQNVIMQKIISDKENHSVIKTNFGWPKVVFLSGIHCITEVIGSTGSLEMAIFRLIRKSGTSEDLCTLKLSQIHQILDPLKISDTVDIG